MDLNFSCLSVVSPPDTRNVQSQAFERIVPDNGMQPSQSLRRRASKACQCCRSRKVRCDVVEHGIPCTNCRLDEVRCIIPKSKRTKKRTPGDDSPAAGHKSMEGAANVPASTDLRLEFLQQPREHDLHSMYQNPSSEHYAIREPRRSIGLPSTAYNPDHLNRQRSGLSSDVLPLLDEEVSPLRTCPPVLPSYIKPLPDRFGDDEINYLQEKGALTIPHDNLRNELIRCYAEVIHPFMPLLDLHDFVATLDCEDGSKRMSLLLFQAVMFAGVASVDMRHLEIAGYSARRDARGDFFIRTRLLYDFDLEEDRITLIQSLLMMTYWYETPDAQKDSHHWMGIAVSLAQATGLHRNAAYSTTIDPATQKLWKRIWWSMFMRDHLIALGMRKPTRIKATDFDVPMLVLDDFEIAAIPEKSSCIPAGHRLLRDVNKQRQLALLCVEKAKLCVCINSVLSIQYSVVQSRGDTGSGQSAQSTMVLHPRRAGSATADVLACDKALRNWRDALPKEARYEVSLCKDVGTGDGYVFLNCSLLHMIYYAGLSALHRPQLASSGIVSQAAEAAAIGLSRKAVHLAANEITNISNTLYDLDLVRLLPTSGITILLPATIIHFLETRTPDEAARRAGLQGFCRCMQIIARLREVYTAADYSIMFLDAAIRKAEPALLEKSIEVKYARDIINSTRDTLEAGHRLKITNPPTPSTDRGRVISLLEEGIASSHTSAETALNDPPITDVDIADRLNTYLVLECQTFNKGASGACQQCSSFSSGVDPISTPKFEDRMDMDMNTDTDDAKSTVDGPGTEGANKVFSDGAIMIGMGDVEPDFDRMVKLDSFSGSCEFEYNDPYGVMQSESSGFATEQL